MGLLPPRTRREQAHCHIGRAAVLGGLRQFTAAFLATGMAFLIGHLVGAHVG
jgi:hypothetical protein